MERMKSMFALQLLGIARAREKKGSQRSRLWLAKSITKSEKKDREKGRKKEREKEMEYPGNENEQGQNIITNSNGANYKFVSSFYFYFKCID